MIVFSRRLSFPCLLLVPNTCSVPVWTGGEVPFVPTPVQVIDRMLEIAWVTPQDVVYDLGSGDGAVIIRASKKFGVQGVGIEIDAEPVRKAQANPYKEKVEHLVEFRVQDALLPMSRKQLL
jgi:cyclopropane fatty-acyl-phospholipid synthase-like methyltransferase